MCEQDKVAKERGYSGIANRISGSCMSHRRISGSCTSRATVGYQGVVRHVPP